MRLAEKSESLSSNRGLASGLQIAQEYASYHRMVQDLTSSTKYYSENQSTYHNHLVGWHMKHLHYWPPESGSQHYQVPKTK